MTRKMNYGIKISYTGIDVLRLDKENVPQNIKIKNSPIIVSFLGKLFLEGARLQITRYKEVSSHLAVDPPKYVSLCFHETSTLFEDLDSIAHYTRKLNRDHKHHNTWRHIRNLLRHSIRDEIGETNHKAKNNRANNLELNPKLELSMGFDIDAIKIGGTLVYLREIEDYLEWAENILNNHFIVS